MRRLHRLNLAAFLVLGLTSPASAGDPLIDNRSEALASGDTLDSPGEAKAQAFTTGGNAFVVEALSLSLDVPVASQVDVKLWAGPGSVPVTLVEDFGTRTVSSGGLAVVEFPSVGFPVLDANTRYWVSVANVSGGFDWTVTGSMNSGGGGTLVDVVSESADGGATWPTSTAPGDFRRLAILGAIPGEIDTTFLPPDGPVNTVRTVLPQADGKLIIAGDFANLGGDLTLDRIARLEADGTLDTTFDPPADLSAEVTCVAQQPDGKLILGGNFVDVGGDATRDRVIRIHPDGSLDTSFNPPELNAFVFCVLLQTDGKIVVGGDFGSVGGDATLNRIVRLNSDGSVDESFDPPADLFPGVLTAVQQDDGKLVVGGKFVNAGGDATLDKVMRLNTDGSVDTSFDPVELDPSNDIFLGISTLNIQPDGKILVGGQQLDVGGDLTLDHLIRLESDGSLDTSFNPPDNLNGLPYSVALQADGKLVVGGFFTNVGGNPDLDKLMRLNDDGSLDDSFDPPGNISTSVDGVTLQSDGKVLISGPFSDLNGTMAYDRLARLENDRAISSLTSPDRFTLRWLRGGASPEANHVRFEASTDGETTFTFLGAGARIPGGWEYTGVNIPKVATIRAIAYVTGGYNNGSTSLREERIDVYTHSAPTISLKGRKRVRTSRRNYTVRGFAADPDGDVVRVRYLDSRPRGRRLRSAKGTTRWRAKVKLKNGTNKVRVQAYDSRGARSKRLRVTLIRR